jgi:uncharacterized protein YqjF (DUF2071 family)
MRLPVIQGTIRRRILANFRVDPEVMKREIPSRFSLQLQNGHAVAGICLIRLEHVRPRNVPEIIGLSSENAAHRVAVIWDEHGKTREGVFISRRDTNSQVNSLLGGRIFPGEHHRANFSVEESDLDIALKVKSEDGNVALEIAGRVGSALPAGSMFQSLQQASAFFERGSIGYSVTQQQKRLDGLELRTANWLVEPLNVSSIYSSYFSDKNRFPAGSIEFDHALIMRDIKLEWHSVDDLYV